MGRSTDAHCYACGYDKGFSVGGGMHTYEEDTRWPVSCNDCHEINLANIRVSPLTCSVCGSTKVTEVQNAPVYAGDGNEENVRCWERKLTNGHYRCPSCKKYELRFDTDFAKRGKIRWD